MGSAKFIILSKDKVYNNTLLIEGNTYPLMSSNQAKFDSLFSLLPFFGDYFYACKVIIHDTTYYVEKIYSLPEFNAALVNEIIAILKTKPYLILTGSCALNLYMPLYRYIKNIDVLITHNNYKIYSKVETMDFNPTERQYDNRSWGYINIDNFYFNVLIKNKEIKYNTAFETITGAKVSNIEDILNKKLQFELSERYGTTFKHKNDLLYYKDYHSVLNKLDLPELNIVGYDPSELPF